MSTGPMRQFSREQHDQDERVSHNLDQLNEFLRAAIADASILDQIPDGAMLIFEPVDDPSVRERITAAAKRQGRPVAFVNLAQVKAGATR